MKKFLAVATAALLSFASATPASAATYLKYVLTGDYSAEWWIDVGTPADEATTDAGIGFYDVQGHFPGALFDYVADVYFYNSTFGDGGFALVDHYGGDVLLLNAISEQLYSGNEEGAFTLLTGSFDFVNFGSDLLHYHLNVSEHTTPAVPEPATWALMLLGFGTLGGALRARKQTVSFA